MRAKRVGSRLRPVRSSLTGPSAGGDRRPSTRDMDECQPCAGDRARDPSRTARIPPRYAPQLIRAPGPDHSLSRRSRTTGSLLPASRGAGSGGPTGSPPMADGTRFPWFRDAEEICDMRHFFGRVFNPIAYEFAGACHDETSSSARGSRRPRPPGPAEAIRPGWAHDRATRATGSSGTLRVGTQRADGLGIAAVGPRSVGARRRRVMTIRHRESSTLGRRPGSTARRCPYPGASSRRPGRWSSPGSRTSGRTDSLDPGPSR